MLSKPLVDALLEFRRARDWEQFHSPRNVAAAISVESAELLEFFVWASEKQIPEITERSRSAIADEIADIAILLTYLVHDLSVDLEAAVTRKMQANAMKYPLEKAHGSNRKYSDL